MPNLLRKTQRTRGSSGNTPLFVADARPSGSSGAQRMDRGADAERRSSPWQRGAIQRRRGLRVIHISQRRMPSKPSHASENMTLFGNLGQKASLQTGRVGRRPLTKKKEHLCNCDLRPYKQYHFQPYRSWLVCVCLAYEVCIILYKQSILMQVKPKAARLCDSRYFKSAWWGMRYA